MRGERDSDHTCTPAAAALMPPKVPGALRSGYEKLCLPDGDAGGYWL